MLIANLDTVITAIIIVLVIHAETGVHARMMQLNLTAHASQASVVDSVK